MFIESLESRTLFAASAVSSAVAADRLQIQADLTKFKSDIAAQCAILWADCSALQADDVKQDAVLAPLFKTLHSDVTAMQTQLAADCLAECTAVLNDQSVILAVDAKILADKGNASALKTDHVTLLTDQIKLQADEITGLNARLSTRQTDYTQISADLTAIFNAVGNDVGATAKVKADVQKFVTDRTNSLNVFEGALQNLITDRTKLVADLTAMQNPVIVD
jgi:hypothetical protein